MFENLRQIGKKIYKNYFYGCGVNEIFFISLSAKAIENLSCNVELVDGDCD